MKQIASTEKGQIEYRLEGQRNKPTVLVLDGGHTHCDMMIGHQLLLLKLGYQLLIPSRPGYGKTPLTTGKSTEEFADALVSLLNTLNIDKVILLGISVGGRQATQLASLYPLRVDKIILLSALGHSKWPDKITRFMAYLLFNAYSERFFWAFFRIWLRLSPIFMIKGMMRNLSTLKPNEIIKQMSDDQLKNIIEYFKSQRSKSGFINDLSIRSGELHQITAPSLIIHSKFDGSVDISHAEYLAKNIKDSELYISEAEHHLLWFSSHNQNIEQKISNFLQT